VETDHSCAGGRRGPAVHCSSGSAQALLRGPGVVLP
jgi:hypothetical protein